MNKFSLESLTEGIRSRHLGEENARLTEKWGRTGLLRGLEGTSRENMGRLLENQAAELLREQSSISTGGGSLASSGDLRGFSNIAFPIVRRVFGGLVANELVSIQPMSLPSGLLFYLDYTYGSNVGGDASLSTGNAGANNQETYSRGDSIYNNPTGKGVRSGSLATGGQYDLAGATYTKVHSSSLIDAVLASGSFGTSNVLTDGALMHATGTDGRMLQFDPQLTTLIEEDAINNAQDGDGQFQLLFVSLNEFADTVDLTNAKDISLFDITAADRGVVALGSDFQGGQNVLNLRRLNQLGTFANSKFTANPLVKRGDANAVLLAVVSGAYAQMGNAASLTASFAVSDSLNVEDGSGSTLTIPSFESDFGATPSPVIPEIDIKVESIAVTAATRKLRARWSPELAQDLNAYHSLDAEVELTQILSEQVALEIDREILNDLLVEAKGANLFWSRAPGKFVNKETGSEVTLSSTLAAGPRFTGTVREWYETLTETIIDVANTIHRKTLRGSANFIVVSPDMATILEASVLYRPSYSLDGEGQVSTPFTLGAEKVGTLSNRFTVYKDPYFPRNKILVGYKGGSYLETGYVYAPYVPLIVTPTIFAPEDFTPRKGVMTRYGKKMVRADFYGTVTCLDLNVI
tara:strand:+ start:8679 stop:10583 length:1905 start_codon:yes stop_codon:yes gene_type:complete